VIVLGFDTATQSTAVALRLDDASTLRARDDPAADAHPGHATRLLMMADELLAQAGLSWDSLDRIAVGLGPGRFTGLRVGIATARGLAQSRSLELVGVSSLRALAHAAARDGTDGRGVLAVIDARRGEAFAAAWPAAELACEEQTGDQAAEDREIVFPRALKPADLDRIVALIDQSGGSPQQRWLAVGDGAVHFRGRLEAAGVEVPQDGSLVHLLDAGSICELGARAAAVQSPEEVLPDYRRMPDAALARERPVALRGAAS
jgi:tRNA threonylcarbamoyladenosine biosynthesis protein TsaB